MELYNQVQYMHEGQFHFVRLLQLVDKSTNFISLHL